MPDMERSAWRGTAGRALQPVADCFLLTMTLAAWILKRLVGSVVRRCRRAGAPGASGRGGGAGDATLSARLGWLAFLLSVGRAMADVLFAVEPSLRMGGVPAGLIPLSLSNALLPLTAATFILLLGLLDSYVREPSAAPPGPSTGHATATFDGHAVRVSTGTWIH